MWRGVPRKEWNAGIGNSKLDNNRLSMPIGTILKLKLRTTVLSVIENKWSITNGITFWQRTQNTCCILFSHFRNCLYQFQPCVFWFGVVELKDTGWLGRMTENFEKQSLWVVNKVLHFVLCLTTYRWRIELNIGTCYVALMGGVTQSFSWHVFMSTNVNFEHCVIVSDTMNDDWWGSERVGVVVCLSFRWKVVNCVSSSSEGSTRSMLLLSDIGALKIDVL